MIATSTHSQAGKACRFFKVFSTSAKHEENIEYLAFSARISPPSNVSTATSKRNLVCLCLQIYVSTSTSSMVRRCFRLTRGIALTIRPSATSRRLSHIYIYMYIIYPLDPLKLICIARGPDSWFPNHDTHSGSGPPATTDSPAGWLEDFQTRVFLCVCLSPRL